jgi:hypothetical protein
MLTRGEFWLLSRSVLALEHPRTSPIQLARVSKTCERRQEKWHHAQRRNLIRVTVERGAISVNYTQKKSDITCGEEFFLQIRRRDDMCICAKGGDISHVVPQSQVYVKDGRPNE